MAYEVMFAGVSLSDYCTVLNIERSVLPPRTNLSKDITAMNGSLYTGYHYGERTIGVEVMIPARTREEYVRKVRELASVLHTESPCELIVSDEPDKYYYAVLDGATDLDRGVFSGSLTLNFICHDPIAYSTEWKSFEPNANNIVTIENEGTSNANMNVMVEFKNDACFLQVTNHQGRTVLVGRPKLESSVNKKTSPTVVSEECLTTDSFTTLSPTLLDDNRQVTGTYTISSAGYGIECNNFGTGVDKVWTGSAFRRNVGTNLDEFEVRVGFVFSSQGTNYTPSQDTSTGTYGKYKVNAKAGLIIRKSASTSSTRLAAMPYGTQITALEISGKWIKHTTKVGSTSYTGWSHSDYLTKVTTSTSTSSSNLGTYQVNTSAGLIIREKASTSSKKLATMPNGTTVKATSISGKWIKHTTTVSGKSYTGWSHTDYLKKISSASKLITKATDYADDELGMLEVYGYDQNGTKLFKSQLYDSSAYYEYVKPRFYIGGTKVLDDGKTVPSPRKVVTKDKDGKVVSTESAVSGVFGDWNDLDGQIVIKRTKNAKGTYIWSLRLYRYKDGKIVKTLKPDNDLSSSKYPTGSLNYLGFFLGRYGQYDPVDVMRIKSVQVKNLSPQKSVTANNNQEIFEKGDILNIDFESGLTTINNVECMSHVDIGTEFFECPVGLSQIAIKTDDKSADISVGIQERFL